MKCTVCVAGLYQWCYDYLTDYVHPYVAVGIMILLSTGILAAVFLLFRNGFNRLSEKWDDHRQYYDVTDVKT